MQVEKRTFDSLFEEGLQHAIQYKEEFGNLLVKESYVCDDGYNLGTWLANKRSKMQHGVLCESQQNALEAIGVNADLRDEIWKAKYFDLLSFLKAGGKLKDAKFYNSFTGVQLDRWYGRERTKCKNGICSDERVQLLEELHKLVVQNRKNHY